jgi:hypothetical protein
MYQNSFETDVMDDLSFDAAEGPAHSRQAYDAYEEDFGDEFDAYDEEESADDEFIGGLVRRTAGAPGGPASADDYDAYDEGFDEGDEFEGAEAYDEFDTYDEFEDVDAYEGDFFDSFEDAVADAMDAEDTDEFLRRVRRLASGAVRVARRVAPVVGRIARAVAPIASAIPLPQAQAIGRIASLAGRLMADGADEYEALDAMIDMADEYDAIDAAAPIIAGLTLRATTPRLARAPLPVRRQAVQAVTRTMQNLAQRQGATAARAAVRVVRAVGQRPIPARAIASTVRRVVPQIARRPAQLRQLSRPLAAGAARGLRRPVGAMRRLRQPLAGGMGRPMLRRRPGGMGPRRRRGGVPVACRICARQMRSRLRTAW